MYIYIHLLLVISNFFLSSFDENFNLHLGKILIFSRRLVTLRFILGQLRSLGSVNIFSEAAQVSERPAQVQHEGTEDQTAESCKSRRENIRGNFVSSLNQFHQICYGFPSPEKNDSKRRQISTRKQFDKLVV